MWWMRTSGVPASTPPGRPRVARNSSMVLRSKSVTGDSVDQAEAAVRQFLGFAELEPAAGRGRPGEGALAARDQGVDDQPQLVHQAGVGGGGGYGAAAHQVDVLAVGPLERRHLVEIAQDARVGPRG